MFSTVGFFRKYNRWADEYGKLLMSQKVKMNEKRMEIAVVVASSSSTTVNECNGSGWGGGFWDRAGKESRGDR